MINMLFFKKFIGNNSTELYIIAPLWISTQTGDTAPLRDPHYFNSVADTFSQNSLHPPRCYFSLEEAKKQFEVIYGDTDAIFILTLPKELIDKDKKIDLGQIRGEMIQSVVLPAKNLFSKLAGEDDKPLLIQNPGYDPGRIAKKSSPPNSSNVCVVIS